MCIQHIIKKYEHNFLTESTRVYNIIIMSVFKQMLSERRTIFKCLLIALILVSN